MFRKMRRFRQQISNEDCIDVLVKEKRGVLSMTGEDGYPYGIPMNHWYCEADGKLYFHGAKEGYKIDLIQKNNKVCYTVFEKGVAKEGEWALNVRCVVVFGRITVVDDVEKVKKICTEVSHKFIDDEEYIHQELENAMHRVMCLELTPDHITGKLVKES